MTLPVFIVLRLFSVTLPVFRVSSLFPEVSTDDDIPGRVVIGVLWYLWVVVTCLECSLLTGGDFLTAVEEKEDVLPTVLLNG